MTELRIGTSGWAYPHWAGTFYPSDLPDSEWLSYYAERFTSVELNNSFYQLPAAATLEHWRNTVPAEFTFAVKASRYITHMKKLNDPKDTVPRFLRRMDMLGPKLGPVLFQLPPRWGCNPERLHHFLTSLPAGYRYAFEFRDPSWFCEPVEELLESFGAGFCIYDLAGLQSPATVTGNLAYVRLHGPGDAYQGSYDEHALSAWAAMLQRWCAGGRDVYCFFDNDEAGYAAANAARLHELTGT